MIRQVFLQAFCLFLATLLPARDIHVPREYQFIRQAISASQPGDVIHLAPGIYTEEVVVSSGISLIGNPARETVLQCPAERGAVLKINSAHDVKIENITFRHLREENYFAASFFGIVTVLDSEVFIRNCRFEKSGRVGFLATGSRITMESCEALNNRTTGIVLQKTDPQSRIRDTRSHDNGWHGIAGGGWKSNVWLDKKPPMMEDANLQGVTVENNGRSGFEFSYDDVPVLGDCITWNNLATNAGELRALAGVRDITQLEAIAGHFRREKVHDNEGEWALESYYRALDDCIDAGNAKDVGAFTSVLDEWKTQYPNSVTPHLGEAILYTGQAWASRGSGYANTVSKQGWQDFGQYLRKAEAKFTEIEKMNAGDPHLYAAWTTAGMGLGYSHVDMKVLRDRGAEIDPSYDPTYYNQAYAMLPRWLGGASDPLKIAKEARARAREGEGPKAFARVAVELHTYESADTVLRVFGFNYDEIKEGHELLLAQYPNSIRYHSSLASFATAAQDQATAKRIFESMGPEYDRQIWKKRKAFDAALAWAEGGGQPPPPITSPASNAGPAVPVVTQRTWIKLSIIMGFFAIVLLAVMAVLIVITLRHRRQR